MHSNTGLSAGAGDFRPCTSTRSDRCAGAEAETSGGPASSSQQGEHRCNTTAEEEEERRKIKLMSKGRLQAWAPVSLSLRAGIF